MNIEKWRDNIIDPYSIKFNNNLIIKDILSYPYAANDVYKCLGNDCIFYLKVQRDDKGNINNESNILKELEKYNFLIPKVLDSGKVDKYDYIVTSELLGLRLSQIEDFNKSVCLKEYGRMLSLIHAIKPNCDKIKIRKINDIPDYEIWKKYPILKKYIDWLEKNIIEMNYKTFIHGDFHYANILYKDDKISGILDWEYSGMGSKEQDIAWAIVRRQTQNFLRTKKELEIFLKGYKEIGSYNEKDFKWYLVNSYVHFYIINNEKDKKYSKFVLRKIEELIR